MEQQKFFTMDTKELTEIIGVFKTIKESILSHFQNIIFKKEGKDIVLSYHNGQTAVQKKTKILTGTTENLEFMIGFEKFLNFVGNFKNEIAWFTFENESIVEITIDDIKMSFDIESQEDLKIAKTYLQKFEDLADIDANSEHFVSFDNKYFGKMLESALNFTLSKIKEDYIDNKFPTSVYLDKFEMSATDKHRLIRLSYGQNLDGGEERGKFFTFRTFDAQTLLKLKKQKTVIAFYTFEYGKILVVNGQYSFIFNAKNDRDDYPEFYNIVKDSKNKCVHNLDVNLVKLYDIVKKMNKSSKSPIFKMDVFEDKLVIAKTKIPDSYNSDEPLKFEVDIQNEIELKSKFTNPNFVFGLDCKKLEETLESLLMWKDYQFKFSLSELAFKPLYFTDKEGEFIEGVLMPIMLKK